MKAENYDGSTIQKVFIKLGFDEGGFEEKPKQAEPQAEELDDCPF
jgi:hypothetical protein